MQMIWYQYKHNTYLIFVCKDDSGRYDNKKYIDTDPVEEIYMTCFMQKYAEFAIPASADALR